MKEEVRRKKPKLNLNVRLLRRVQKHILEEPRRFFMAWFSIRAKNQEEWENKSWSDCSKKMPPCGTAACICGWVNILTKGRHPDDVDRGAEMLGLGTVDNAHALFGVSYWPEPFQTNYLNATSPRQRAQSAARRIDHFIKYRE